jgi:hypothetical protein
MRGGALWAVVGVTAAAAGSSNLPSQISGLNIVLVCYSERYSDWMVLLPW